MDFAALHLMQGRAGAARTPPASLPVLCCDTETKAESQQLRKKSQNAFLRSVCTLTKPANKLKKEKWRLRKKPKSPALRLRTPGPLWGRSADRRTSCGRPDGKGTSPGNVSSAPWCLAETNRKICRYTTTTAGFFHQVKTKQKLEQLFQKPTARIKVIDVKDGISSV